MAQSKSSQFDSSRYLDSSRYRVSLSYNPRSMSALLKRYFDIFIAILAIGLFSPLGIAIAIIIKVTSSGPVIYDQERVGLGGRIFRIYKFRTMVDDAESLLPLLATKNEAMGPIFKMKSDPRVTPFGRFLRKSSFDELPQLWNVLKGDMSIVGPRPPLPREVAQYKPWHLRRLSVPQGLTCFWQISGRSNICFEEWVQLDLKYIENWSLLLDLKIITQTIFAVIRGNGAY